MRSPDTRLISRTECGTPTRAGVSGREGAFGGAGWVRVGDIGTELRIGLDRARAASRSCREAGCLGCRRRFLLRKCMAASGRPTRRSLLATAQRRSRAATVPSPSAGTVGKDESPAAISLRTFANGNPLNAVTLRLPGTHSSELDRSSRERRRAGLVESTGGWRGVAGTWAGGPHAHHR